MVSPAKTPDAGLFFRGFFRRGGFAGRRLLLLALALSLVAIAADQFAAPILHSSSPPWATAVCLLLIWRRGQVPSPPGDPPLDLSLSIGRLVAFLVAHGALILLARSLSSAFQSDSGAMTIGGT